MEGLTLGLGEAEGLVLGEVDGDVEGDVEGETEGDTDADVEPDEAALIATWAPVLPGVVDDNDGVGLDSPPPQVPSVSAIPVQKSDTVSQ